LPIENIICVDEVNGLRATTSHIEGYKIVGLDFEMKPNYVEDSKPNKVVTDLHFEKKIKDFQNLYTRFVCWLSFSDG